MKVISIVVLSILALGLLAFFAWLGISAYQQRQGPALESTTEPLFATRTPQPAAALSKTVVSPSSIKPVTATPEIKPTEGTTTETATVIPSGEDSCGESGAWNVLFLGSDYGETSLLNGSDLTRMLRADFTNKRVVVYTFSRDLWVDTTDIGLTNPNIDAARLGTVFLEGRLRSLQFAELDTMVDGTRATAKMLEKNFSLSTDHYLTLDLQNLAALA